MRRSFSCSYTCLKRTPVENAMSYLYLSFSIARLCILACISDEAMMHTNHTRHGQRLCDGRACLSLRIATTHRSAAPFVSSLSSDDVAGVISPVTTSLSVLTPKLFDTKLQVDVIHLHMLNIPPWSTFASSFHQ